MTPKTILLVGLFVCASLLFNACAGAPDSPPGAQFNAAVTTAPLKAAVATAPPVSLPAPPTVDRASPTATAPGSAAKPGKAATAGVTPQPSGSRTAPPFLLRDVLGRPTDRSVTLNVVPTQNLEVYVEYGAETGVYTGRTQPVTLLAGRPFEITLDGLQRDALIYYRVRYRQPGASEFSAVEEGSFHTQRAPGSSFTFAIQGDSHPERENKQFNADLYTRTLLTAAADRPDFYMTIGDDFSVDNLKLVNPNSVTQLYINQRRWLGSVGAPVFLVNGNHEQASLANLDGTPNNVAVWAQTARNAYFPQPAPDGFYTGDSEPVPHIGLLRDYYAFTWGDALFVVIDPYWHSPQTVDNQFGVDRDQKGKRDLWNITLGEAQYRWFKTTLETSPAKYKFVFTHHVNGTGRGGVELAHTHEWGDAAGYPIHRPGWEKPIHQLMADNGVTVFFQGHDHIFARQELDGVIYQTLPEPANPFYSWENGDAYRSGDKLPNSGYVRVTVGDKVKVDYVRTFLPRDETNDQVSGEVAFSYSVGGAPRPVTSAPTAIVPTAVAVPTAMFPGNVVLGWPTDRSVTASLLADTSLDAYLEYGVASGVYTYRTASVRMLAGQPVDTLIERLVADTQYFYRLRFHRPGEAVFAAGTERTFHTQRQPGSSFTFTLDADPHNRDPNFNADVYRATLQTALADKPDFHINLGDTFMAEKLAPSSYAQVEPTYREMRPFFAFLADSAPLFLVNGNHDGELGWLMNGTPNNLAVWAMRARQAFYPSPVPGNFYHTSATPEPLIGVRDGYYAWTWGDALFVVLDPYWYSTRQPRAVGDNWGLTLGRVQYEWLKRTLEASDAKFKFVFAHNLVGGMDQNMRGGIEAADKYEWGGHNADGSWGFDDHRLGWGEPIHQLMVRNGVTIFFHGHDHLFVKQDLDGIVYQECPQPSYTLYNNTGSAAAYGYRQGEILGCCGYLRVTVAPAMTTVDYVRSYRPKDETGQRRSGVVSYTYTIVAR